MTCFYAIFCRSAQCHIVAGMDFAMSAKAQDYHKRLTAFMTEYVFPAEAEYDRYREEAGPDDHTVPPVVEELKVLAKERGLWNLFLPAVSGLTNLEYAPLAELTGWSLEIAPEVTNCAAPDTGNMETLHLFATEEQRKQWLEPLLAGEIRSGFSMTEPAVASSDARNIETTINRDGGDYVINGRKWWTTGASDPRCKVLIVMGRTNPDAASHQQQSMVLVPIDTPGVNILRSTPVFGWQDQHGHCEIVYDNVRVPVENLLGEEGAGFAIAQARLGPGRIHHCMRALGAAERALALMVDRVQKRVAFGKPLAEQGVVREQVAPFAQRDRPGSIAVREGGVDHRPARQQGGPPVGQPDQGRRTDGRLQCHRPRDSGARRGRASATTSRWPGSTPGIGRCDCSTGPTRCTCAPSPAPRSVGEKSAFAAAVTSSGGRYRANCRGRGTFVMSRRRRAFVLAGSSGPAS